MGTQVLYHLIRNHDREGLYQGLPEPGNRKPKASFRDRKASKPSSTWSGTMTKKGHHHVILHRSTHQTHQDKHHGYSQENVYLMFFQTSTRKHAHSWKEWLKQLVHKALKSGWRIENTNMHH